MEFFFSINVIVFWASRCFKFCLICDMDKLKCEYSWINVNVICFEFHLRFQIFFNNNASFNSKFKMNLFHFFISFFFAIILFSNYLLYALSCLEIVENINNIITFVYRFKIIVPYWSPIFAIICLLFLFQT